MNEALGQYAAPRWTTGNAIASVQPAPSDQPPGEISREFICIENNLGSMLSALDQLQRRLAPVLAANEANKAAGVDPSRSCSSHMARRMCAIDHEIEGAGVRIREMLELLRLD